MNWLKKLYRNARMLIRKWKYERIYRRQKGGAVPKQWSRKGPYLLFITNDNFGGTRQYERMFLKERKHVILLRRLSYGERPDLIYEAINLDADAGVLLHLHELSALWELEYHEIVVNSLVHVSNCAQILAEAEAYKQAHKDCRITYMVHDFHSICPICNLFDKGEFCRLDCKNRQCRLLVADRKIRIDTWREMWARFFPAADEIRCFSASSRELFLQAYPSVPRQRVTVVPHDIGYIPFYPIEGVERLPFHLGVIGDCSADFKGRPVVRHILRTYGDDFPITLIGSQYKHYKIRKKKVRYLGAYPHEKLQEWIEREGISHVLFPSLWPETFSYLVSELMAMDLPILCFNMGAQAEKVKGYPKGIVCDSAEALCRELERLRG